MFWKFNFRIVYFLGIVNYVGLEIGGKFEVEVCWEIYNID